MTRSEYRPYRELARAVLSQAVAEASGGGPRPNAAVAQEWLESDDAFRWCNCALVDYVEFVAIISEYVVGDRSLTQKPVFVRDIQTKSEVIYDNAEQAAEAMGVSTDSVTRALRIGRLIVKRYEARYV